MRMKILHIIAIVIPLMYCNQEQKKRLEDIPSNSLNIDIDSKKDSSNFLPVDSSFINKYIINNTKILTLFDVQPVLYNDVFYKKYFFDSSSRALIKKYYEGNKYFYYRKNALKNSDIILVIFPVNEIIEENYSLFLFSFSEDDSLLSTIQIGGRYKAVTFGCDNHVVFSPFFSDTFIHTRKVSKSTISDLPVGMSICDTTDFFYKYIPKAGFVLYKRIYNWEVK